WNNNLRLEITVYRQPRHLRTLTIGRSPDRHENNIRMIKLLDQRHVAENPGIAFMIHRATIGKLEHVAHRPSTRFAAMHRRYNVQLHISKSDIIANIDRLD